MGFEVACAVLEYNMRINRYLASSGIASRRKCEELVKDGRVTVNGVTIDSLSTVIAENDTVMVDKKPVKPASQFVYIVLNKPRGVMCTCFDPQGRRTILDIVRVKERIFPVGRLDYDTEGLLILTNDGDFAKKVTHPSGQIEKVYVATLDKEIATKDLKKLETGIDIDGEKTCPAKAKILYPNVVELTITQGRNRQVRRMFEALGYNVTKLKRIAIGAMRLDDLPVGKYKITSSRPLY